MSRKKRYEPRAVDVSFTSERRSSWKWNGRTIRGTESVYTVTDRNFDRLNIWEFTVRVPRNLGQIVVQPHAVPGKKAFAGLERRSIVFVKATKHPYRARLYCKANLADPSGKKNRLSTSRGDRGLLPRWFDYFRPHMRLKNTVTTTAGHDGQSQVVTVGQDDHERMVRLFFALRVWVLQEKLTIK